MAAESFVIQFGSTCQWAQARSRNRKRTAQHFFSLHFLGGSALPGLVAGRRLSRWFLNSDAWNPVGYVFPAWTT